MPLSPIRHLLRLLLVSFVGIVLAIFLVEALLRVSGYTPYYLNARAFQPSPVADMVYELSPGFKGLYAGLPISINQMGFRGGETLDEIQKATLRIAVIGDSVAFGQGVREGQTLADQLSARLRSRLQEPVAVVNLGVPGYDTCQEYAMFRERAVPLKPRDALLIYVDNDTNPPSIHVKDGAMVAPDVRTGLVGDFMGWLRKTSAAYNFAWAHWQAIKNRHPIVDQTSSVRSCLRKDCGVPGPNAAVAFRRVVMENV